MLSYNQNQQGYYNSQPMYPQLPPTAGPPAPVDPFQSQPHPGQPAGYQVAQYQQGPGQVAAPAQGSSYSAPQGAWAGRAGAPTYSSYMPSALGPQQLESIPRDEDPVYGPVGRARSKIDRALISDVELSPDLAETFGHGEIGLDELTAANEPQYVAPPSQSPAFRIARITRTTPLPDALHQELNYKHLTARMGLFEEIERAWFTVDNRLFLWDYNDGRDFSRYDQGGDTIQSVGLVKARKDVFVDDITHLLVICTTTKATLLGMSRSDKGELSLYATNLSAETATSMVDIRGTDSGRIFLLGANKDLYELEYSTSSGWLSSGSKMWITNRSTGYLSTWVPTVLTGDRDGIESFVVDSQQGRLFALRKGDVIEWFDIAGTKFESRGKYSSFRNDITRLHYVGSNPAGARIVSISVVGGQESKRAWLVAISASGARLFLGQANTYFSHQQGLQVVGHRGPLPDTPRAARESFYSSGTTIAVQHEESPSATSRLTFAAPAVGRQAAMRENFDSFQPPILQEWTIVESLPSQVWTIAEVTSTDPARAPSYLRRSDGIALSALPRQTTVPARQFLILATSGVFWAAQPRPVDMLESDLEYEKEGAVVASRTAFGRVQLAAMAIQMGVRAGVENKPGGDLATASANILLSSEPPVIRTSQTGGRSIVYSPRHDGFAQVVARLLRPIWKAKVIIPAPAKKYQLGVSDKVLLDVQARLAELNRYVDDHPFPRHQAEGDAKIAWDQEESSMHGLITLEKQAIEAISFVLLLNDYKLPDVIAKCDPQTQSTLSGLSFEGLLTSTNGRDVARKLVTALIELQIGAELGIDNLSAILQQRCGTFVQPGDVVLYKAEESLRRAESTRDANERAEQLAESLRLFERAAISAPAAVFPRLQDATSRYRALKDVRGAIELPLRVATEIDPDDKAGDYVRDGRQPGDPRGAFLEQRQECYQLVVEALGNYDEELNRAVASNSPSDAVRMRDEAYGMAIASDDELFHYYLYDWTVALGRADQLLEFDTPFIQQYLQLTTSNVPERRDLLWKYYARREEYLSAAKALSDLATREGDMSLEERVYYLAQALTNAKSAVSLGSDDVEFATGLQERIDVAQVQLEIVRSVEGHPEMTAAEKAEPLLQLNAELLGLDDLYQHFARPLRLLEPILLILKTADTRVEDVCVAVWTQLLRDRAKLVPVDAAVGELLTDLCRKFYPSEGAPPDVILPVIYSESAPFTESTNPGWVSEALLAGGVSLRDLWDIVSSMHDEAGDADTREFYAEEAAALISQWLKDPSAHTLPPADVEQFASAYLLRTNGQTLEPRRAETRKVMTTAKSVAGRY